MSALESTCWTLIRAAAAGGPAEREELARRYLGIVRAYLAARWRGTALRAELDDATQTVFVECFRQGGVLDAAGSGRVPSFRAFRSAGSFSTPAWCRSTTSASSATDLFSFGADTNARSIPGSPASMPTEQANRDIAHLDRSADVFGLGAILREIFTCNPHYAGRASENVRRKAADCDLPFKRRMDTAVANDRGEKYGSHAHPGRRCRLRSRPVAFI